MLSLVPFRDYRDVLEDGCSGLVVLRRNWRDNISQWSLMYISFVSMFRCHVKHCLGAICKKNHWSSEGLKNINFHCCYAQALLRYFYNEGLKQQVLRGSVQQANRHIQKEGLTDKVI